MTAPALRDWVFSVRTFAAAMAALAIALRLDLPRPYWAIATAYIASQPFAGATRSRGAYRAIGTLAGGAAVLVLLPNLVDTPTLLCLAFAAWVGLCLFLGVLDRTPRSYAFMNAGYSAAIIGFPSVLAPEMVFDTVLSRVEEILIGISCAAIAGTVLFPRGAGPALGSKTAAWLQDADRWAADALAGHREDGAYRAARRQLASGIVEIDGLAGSIAWDASAGPNAARAMRALRQDMLMLLPVLSSVDDRVGALTGPERARAGTVLTKISAWLEAKTPDHQVAALQAEIGALHAEATGRLDWPGLMLASLALRLREFVALRSVSEQLRREIAGERPSAGQPTISVRAIPFVQHRDPGMALLSSAAAVVAILLCCTFWIATAWPDGAVAAEMAAVACSFFAQQDDPVPAIVAFLRWGAVAIAVDAILLFAVLPLATSFEMLVLALAPVFLFYGLLMARPATTGTGTALAVNGLTLLGVQSAYAADFASFANSGIAFLLGMVLAAVVTGLMRSVGAAASVRRLLLANWSSLAAAAGRYGKGDRETVGALMLDRISLIASRVTAAELNSDVHRIDPLAVIRIGLNVVELRRGRHGLPRPAQAALEAALDGLADDFASRSRGGVAPPSETLLAKMDAALRAVGHLPPGPARQDVMQGLVGIHRGLVPSRTPSPQIGMAEAAA